MFMNGTVSFVRSSWVTRGLLTICLLFALVGGTGIVVADSDNRSGMNCPEDNPTNAYDRTSDTAVEKSFEGRQKAVERGECITNEDA